MQATGISAEEAARICIVAELNSPLYFAITAGDRATKNCSFHFRDEQCTYN